MKMTHISVALITMASFCQAAPQEQPIVSVSSRANPKATVVYPASDPTNTGNWVINTTFTDEFNGTGLDTTKWNAKQIKETGSNPCGSTAAGIKWDGRQPALFLSSNVVVTGGTLQIIMRRDAANTTIPTCAQGYGYKGYTRALINTPSTAYYGYYEARIKAMNSTGSTGFWIVGSANGYDIEIDLLEYSPKLNNTPNQWGQAWGPPLTVYMSGHLWAYPGHAKNGTDYAPTFIRPTVGWKPTWDGSADFHVYGLDWNADTLTWYVDGVQRRQIKNSNWVVPGCLMFDAEIQPTWFGIPPDRDLPSTMYVDYVRVWNKGSGPAKQNSVLTPATGVSVPLGTTLTNLCTANGPGTFVYVPSTATVACPLSVTANFTPTDTTTYNPASASVAITVTSAGKITPIFTPVANVSVPTSTTWPICVRRMCPDHSPTHRQQHLLLDHYRSQPTLRRPIRLPTTFLWSQLRSPMYHQC